MGSDDTITFFHAPNTRSSGVRLLLEELGAPYELHAINMKAGEQRQAAYLKINPMPSSACQLRTDFTGQPVRRSHELRLQLPQLRRHG